MRDGWHGKLIAHAVGVKLASPGSYYVLDPLTISSIGKRDQKSVGLWKNIHWRPVDLPDSQPTCARMPNPGIRAANRLVIRLVTAKLKAATHSLRNRIRRMGASKSTRSDMTNAAMTMAWVAPDSGCNIKEARKPSRRGVTKLRFGQKPNSGCDVELGV
jgi:hypothetical protein